MLYMSGQRHTMVPRLYHHGFNVEKSLAWVLPCMTFVLAVDFGLWMDGRNGLYEKMMSMCPPAPCLCPRRRLLPLLPAPLPTSSPCPAY